MDESGRGGGRRGGEEGRSGKRDGAKGGRLSGLEVRRETVTGDRAPRKQNHNEERAHE